MKDDSLNDTQRFKVIYCDKCDYTYDPEITRCYCKKPSQVLVDLMKPKSDSVGIQPIKDADGFILDMNNPVVKEIWNAAIEAAAVELRKHNRYFYAGDEIRKLKK